MDKKIKKIKMKSSQFMSQADEDYELNKKPESGKLNQAEFAKLNAKFDLKKILTEIIIKKEHFVMKKESDVHADYDFKKELGQGTYGVVFLGEHKVTKELRAIKEIQRSKIKKYQRFINEVTAMRTLDHPNVIRLFEIYEGKDAVYLI